jgi:hypothetical protein
MFGKQSGRRNIVDRIVAVLVVRPHFYELSCVTMDKRQLSALKFPVRKQVRVVD